MLAHEPFQVFADEGWRRACLETGFTDEAQCALIQRCRAIGAVTLGQGLAALLSDIETPVTYELLAWIGLFQLDCLPDELRRDLLVALAAKDPPLASRIYFFRKDLTQAEKAILRDGFFPSMDTMRERALAEGI